jgi:hypothetical protein
MKFVCEIGKSADLGAQANYKNTFVHYLANKQKVLKFHAPQNPSRKI